MDNSFQPGTSRYASTLLNAPNSLALFTHHFMHQLTATEHGGSCETDIDCITVN